MTPDPQLLTKQVITPALTITGHTIPVRFNLQRGKIARIWGFSLNHGTVTGSGVEYTTFVRKTPNSERAQTPQDNLWASIKTSLVSTTGRAVITEEHIIFPKPYRTSGITVQFHAGQTTSTIALLIIYYDVDDAMKGELVQRWEKSRAKRYTRRGIAP